jgi:hypothetical protein
MLGKYCGIWFAAVDPNRCSFPTSCLITKRLWANFSTNWYLSSLRAGRAVHEMARSVEVKTAYFDPQPRR